MVYPHVGCNEFRALSAFVKVVEYDLAFVANMLILDQVLKWAVRLVKKMAETLI